MSGQSVGPAELDVAEVLTMPAVRNADPHVLAGANHLHRTVRWVHTTELVDIAPLLRGGDLVLTTGIALPENDQALEEFAHSLESSRAAGLLIELGRRWTSLPSSLVGAAESVGLPLVALRREVRFAAVTQAVGERLVDTQVRELREAHRVHDTFTELSIEEAGPTEVLEAVQRLSGSAVVLEDAEHRVLDFRPGPDDPASVLDDWERRSRRSKSVERTGWDASNGWLVSVIGRRERQWGRLVILAPGPPSQRLVAVVERGAAALALHRLHDRNHDTRLRRAHHDLLTALQREAGPGLEQRATLVGFTAAAHRLCGLAVRAALSTTATEPPAHALDEVVAAALRLGETLGLQVVAAAFETDVRLLVGIPARLDVDDTLNRLATELDRRVPVGVTIGAGTTVDGLRAGGRSVREATQVLASIRGGAPGVLHRLADLRVRGLLNLLLDDERLLTHVDRELAPLHRLEEVVRYDVVETLRAVVEHWGSKSTAATVLSVSRPVLYDRISRIERAIGARLDDAEVRLSVHLALLGAELLDRRGEPGRGEG